MPQPTTSSSLAAQTSFSAYITWGSILILTLSFLLYNQQNFNIISTMPPVQVFADVVRRNFDPGQSSDAFWAQWKNPGDVFSVLLILGGDVVGRALAQVSGSPVTPVAFSFGWVAYAVTAVVSAIGENKLMPLPDCACKVINGKSGYNRDNSSWVIGRIVRDFESWMDNGKPDGPIRKHLNKLINDKWEFDKAEAEKKVTGSGSTIKKPKQASLCVSVYKAGTARKGYPGYDKVYLIGFVTSLVQLGIAAIPTAIFGDWGIFLITTVGILLSFVTGSLPQWKQEKWACREESKNNFILTRGNGSQHAIVVLGTGKGLNLEDLAAGQTNVDVSASWITRFSIVLMATLWVLLLITAAGIKQNTWFLLAIGGIGILQNIFVAGWRRFPRAYGIPLEFVEVIGKEKVMKTLYEVEEKYPYIGASMLETFFPGKRDKDEEKKWEEYGETAKDRAQALQPSPAPGQSNGNSSGLASGQSNGNSSGSASGQPNGNSTGSTTQP